MAQLLSGQASYVKNEQSIIGLAMLSVPALKKLPHETQRRLHGKMTCRLLSSGSTIRLGGGKRDDVFFIVMGKAVGVDAQMDTTTIDAMDVGDVFSDHARVADAYMPTSVMMTTNCVVCSMNAADYVRIVAMHDQPLANALWSFSDALNGMSAWLNNELITPKHQQRI